MVSYQTSDLFSSFNRLYMLAYPFEKNKISAQGWPSSIKTYFSLNLTSFDKEETILMINLSSF